MAEEREDKNSEILLWEMGESEKKGAGGIPIFAAGWRSHLNKAAQASAFWTEIPRGFDGPTITKRALRRQLITYNIVLMSYNFEFDIMNHQNHPPLELIGFPLDVLTFQRTGFVTFHLQEFEEWRTTIARNAAFSLAHEIRRAYGGKLLDSLSHTTQPYQPPEPGVSIFATHVDIRHYKQIAP